MLAMKRKWMVYRNDGMDSLLTEPLESLEIRNSLKERGKYVMQQ